MYNILTLATSTQMRRRVMSDMRDMIIKLKLDGFTFNESKLTVIYNIDWGD
jgi:hypothetical protein